MFVQINENLILETDEIEGFGINIGLMKIPITIYTKSRARYAITEEDFGKLKVFLTAIEVPIRVL